MTVLDTEVRPRHRGKPDQDALDWEERRARGGPQAPATEHSKARCTPDSQRAMFHQTMWCPQCDPKGYAENAAKHKSKRRYANRYPSPLTSPDLSPVERLNLLAGLAIGMSPMHPALWEQISEEYSEIEESLR